MNIEIINIGDELLIGQVVNTNASWMGEQLSLNGFPTIQFTIIGDIREHILDALKEAEKRAEVILISGGIGPTKDDITRSALCEYFNTRMIFNEEAYKDIEALFASRGYPVTELNRLQAMLPEKCITIPNKLGTARGMWFEKRRKGGGTTIFISIPGVPFEMKAMMTGEIIPRLKKLFKPAVIFHKTVMTQGVGESFLAEMIAAWEEKLPSFIRLAYLPQPGIVRLRLTGSGNDAGTVRKAVLQEAEKLLQLIPEHIFGYDDEKLEEIIGRLLREKGQTLATAESCTGGYLAHLITSVPGSSHYYKGSVIAYSNDLKERLLGVRSATLEQFGAVSSETVAEMAVGAQKLLRAGFVVATSGIAGPEGGTPGKPVGTTWIAIATPDKIFTKHYLFGDNRERNIRRTALQALNLLRKSILE